jgi:hypothetical protein
MVRILSLDLATNTGWAHNCETNLKLGTWSLSTASEVRQWNKDRLCRRNDPRVARLFNWLSPFRGQTDAVVFEDVQFQSYTQQCQLWSSLRAAVWLAFEGSAIIECVPVMTLKKFATGHGVATKGMMMAAAARDSKNRFAVGPVGRTGEIEFLIDRVTNAHLDDNAADAYHLYRWGQLNLGRTRI